MVGNYIGEGNEKYGKLTALIGIIEIFTITILCGLGTYYYAYEIATVYTTDVDIV